MLHLLEHGRDVLEQLFRHPPLYMYDGGVIPLVSICTAGTGELHHVSVEVFFDVLADVVQVVVGQLDWYFTD